MEPQNSSQPKSNEGQSTDALTGAPRMADVTAPAQPAQDNQSLGASSAADSAAPSDTGSISVQSAAPAQVETLSATDTVTATNPVAIPAQPQANAPATPQPATTAEAVDVVTPAVSATPPVVPAGPKKSKKKWLIPVVGGALIALLAGGYVLGYYLPNRPENAYKIGLRLTGVALDRVIDYAEDRKEYPSYSIDGTATVKQASGSYDIALKGAASETAGNLTIDANISGQKIKAEMVAADAAQSDNPDVYLKVTGVASFLQQMTGDTSLSRLDGQWIAVDHTLLDTYQKQLEAQAGADVKEMPTQEQIADAVAKVQQVNKDYLFTTNDDRAVLVYKSYVGKETRNGRSAFHYKTGYNKDHLKAYVKALGEALNSSKLNDWSKKQADGKNLSALIQLSELEESINKADASKEFDLYVDAGTKIVQSLVYTEAGKGTLTIAQNYTGGDAYPFEVSMKGLGSNKSEGTLGLKLDTKTDKTSFTMKVDSSGSSATSVAMEATLTPSDKKPSIKAPTGATPLIQILQQFGIDPSMLTEGVSTEDTYSDSLTTSQT